MGKLLRHSRLLRRRLDRIAVRGDGPHSRVRKTKYPSRNQRLRHADSDSLLRGTAVVGNSQRTLARAVECGRRHGHVWIRGRCLWSNNNWAGTPADQLPAGI